MSDASEWMAGFYEEYTGLDGNKYKTRVATASMEWVLKATDNKIYYIKFDKNFAKKHLFTFTKKALAKPEDKDKANEAKLQKQAQHRTDEEQGRMCKTCGHSEKRHQTKSGNPVACKEPKGTGQCGCMTFVANDKYAAARTAKGKPTVNPLEGATTRKTTYIVLNEIEKSKFESVLIASIKSAESGWNANTDKHLDWNFEKAGAVITVDLDQLPANWVKAKGATVSVKNVTSDTAKPTFTVFHLNSAIA